MRKKILAIAALLLMSCSMAINAEGQTARQIMDKVCNAFQRMGACKIAFTIDMAQGGQHHSAVGTMTVSGQKFMCQTPGVSTWYDGGTQWTYVQQQKEITITEPLPDEILESNPLAILQNWAEVYTASSAAKSGNNYIINFTPKAQGGIDAAKLTVAQNDWLPSKIVVKMASGAQATIRIQNIHKMAPPSLATFRCNLSQYPGVTVVDLR